MFRILKKRNSTVIVWQLKEGKKVDFCFSWNTISDDRSGKRFHVKFIAMWVTRSSLTGLNCLFFFTFTWKGNRLIFLWCYHDDTKLSSYNTHTHTKKKKRYKKKVGKAYSLFYTYTDHLDKTTRHTLHRNRCLYLCQTWCNSTPSSLRLPHKQSSKPKGFELFFSPTERRKKTLPLLYKKKKKVYKKCWKGICFLHTHRSQINWLISPCTWHQSKLFKFKLKIQEFVIFFKMQKSDNRSIYTKVTIFLLRWSTNFSLDGQLFSDIV